MNHLKKISHVTRALKPSSTPSTSKQHQLSISWEWLKDFSSAIRCFNKNMVVKLCTQIFWSFIFTEIRTKKRRSTEQSYSLSSIPWDSWRDEAPGPSDPKTLTGKYWKESSGERLTSRQMTIITSFSQRQGRRFPRLPCGRHTPLLEA